MQWLWTRTGSQPDSLTLISQVVEVRKMLYGLRRHLASQSKDSKQAKVLVSSSTLRSILGVSRLRRSWLTFRFQTDSLLNNPGSRFSPCVREGWPRRSPQGYGNARLEISVRDNALFFSNRRWIEVEPLLFVRQDGTGYIAFRTDSTGKIAAMFAGGFWSFEKLPAASVRE
ncbi:MAG: hypothetical protein ABR543_16930 [Gemmatimonadaceae bacterium]